MNYAQNAGRPYHLARGALIMLGSMIAIGVLLLIFGVFLIVVGALAWSQRLPGNKWVGLRIPEVRKSKEMWDTAHRIAGPAWTAGGVCMLIGGLVAFVASGWLWVIPVLGFLAGLALVGTGAGMSAHAVAILDAQASQQAASPEPGVQCCSAGDAADHAAGPKVDLGALRRAVQESGADKPRETGA